MGDGPAVSPSWLLACQSVGTAGPELLSAQVTLRPVCCTLLCWYLQSAATWPVAVFMFCSSEIRESLNGEDKASVSCAAQSSVNF